MEVLIKTLGGVESTLNVVRTKITATQKGNMVSLEGIYIAKDDYGNEFLDENGEVIRLNTAPRGGVGFLDGIECTYSIKGYLNT